MAIDKGSIQAECYLGLQMVRGEGVEQDVERGLELIQDVIDRLQLEEAMHIMAGIYAEGQFVSKDIMKAKELYSMAIDSGFAESCFGLGNLFLEEGSPESDARAFETFLKGARMKDLDCMAEVIRMFREGLGTEQSETDALIWEDRYREQDSRIHPYEW